VRGPQISGCVTANSVYEFIGQVKGATSFRVNKEIGPRFKLKWQEGYGVLSLRRDELPKVSRYIDSQEEHHRRGSLSVVLEQTESDADDWPEGEFVGKPPD
jgi:hypothetical protein